MSKLSGRKLSALIQGFPVRGVEGALSQEISSIAFDSREVEDGGLFVAIRGFKQDGFKFVNDAIARGASAFITETPIEELSSLNLDRGKVTAIYVKDCRSALAWVGAEFYGRPSDRMDVYGVTGTNGKTTITYILDSIYKVKGQQSGVIGTIRHRYGDTNLAASTTTPESLDINRMLHEMTRRKIRQCFLEISSHSLVLKRVFGMHFSVGIFTNLSRDHLDFHRTIDRYKEAKKGLFRDNQVEKSVINIDDSVGREIANEFSKNLLSIGIEKKADVMAEDCSLSDAGSCFTLKTPSGSCEIQTHLLGIHNIYNLILAAAGALHQGLSLDQIAKGLCSVNRIPGRFEKVPCRQNFSIIVDYAHTDDALRNVLQAAKSFTPGRVITVFGCGGDRDRGKRKTMGRVAIEESEFTIVTSDNPRTEDPQLIVDDILEGIPSSTCQGKDYEVVVDRKEAIQFAVRKAQPGDLIMIAGKGHEDYQVLKTGVIHFDDREVAQEAARGVL
ncbi:UDP-N-acetylmuramoyl-L-alanyl-D-glutamate--2,6-diaminopimelate ligase [Nitrospinaceae bacterium]|nr:UDP-N-acetylmuramoyl-L-alanyl-D-glutamate--2,6-diaminopimelate ligase [Nitrospinaceae bacterium]